jgi:hypothetical protein
MGEPAITIATLEQVGRTYTRMKLETYEGRQLAQVEVIQLADNGQPRRNKIDLQRLLDLRDALDALIVDNMRRPSAPAP